jgi:hypothetical protein
MARNTSPQGSNPRAETQLSQWDDDAWDQDHDEAAGKRARRLLSRSNSGFHRFGDNIGALRRWLARERWVKRLAIVIAVVMVMFAGCFGGLWWRLGAGPINLEMATPWLAAAIAENIGHGNTVEVGGTQIERAGRIRIAVRIRDIIVRDRDHAIVASAPKAEVRLSDLSASNTRSASPRGAACNRFAHSPIRSRGDGARQYASRTACRPRLARQPEPDRTRRPEPQRNRFEER